MWYVEKSIVSTWKFIPLPEAEIHLLYLVNIYMYEV